MDEKRRCPHSTIRESRIDRGGDVVVIRLCTRCGKRQARTEQGRQEGLF